MGQYFYLGSECSTSTHGKTTVILAVYDIKYADENNYFQEYKM